MINLYKNSQVLKSLFLMAALASPFLISAQHNNEFYNKGSLVTVQAGAQVYIQGDMHHYTATANFNNSGLVEVQGNVYGDVDFQQRGTGTMRLFNRSVNLLETQTISGSYAVRGGQNQIGVNDGSFYHLELANRQGEVFLDGMGFVADVRHSVDFHPIITGFSLPANRIITHTSSQPTGSNYAAVFGLMNPAQGLDNMLHNTISNEGEISNVDNAYVEGVMRRAIATSGGAYGFPMGNQPGIDKGQGVQYFNLILPAGNTYDYLTSYFEIESDNTIAGVAEQCGDTVNWYSGKHHGEWIINAGSADLISEYAMQIFPQHYDSINGTEFFITKNNAIAGQLEQCGPNPQGLTRNKFTGFGEFGFASAGVILSHKLLDIKATPIENKFIQVAWKVEDAHEVFAYEVERSTNAIDFEYIGDIFVEGDMAFEFNFDDMRAQPQIQYYYRVKSILWDGSHSYSPIVSARLQGKANAQGIVLYPNPMQNAFNLDIEVASYTPLDIRIYDVVGRVIYQEKVVAQEGINTYTVSGNNWNAGLYYVQILGDNFTAIKEVVKGN